MTFTLITEGVDLAVGTIAALSGVLAAGLAARPGLGPYPAIFLAPSVGAVMGAMNGAMIASD